MERQQRKFLKVIRRNLIYSFLFVMVCLVLSPERGAAQFFPLSFGPVMGIPYGGFSPVPAFGALAPMGFQSLPLAVSPFSLPNYGWQPSTFMQPSTQFSTSPYISGYSLIPVQSPYGSAYGSFGSSIPIYGQTAYGQPFTSIPTNYVQPAYGTNGSFISLPTSYGQSAYGQQLISLPTNYGQSAYGQTLTSLPTNYGQSAYGQTLTSLPTSYGQSAYGSTTQFTSVPTNYGLSGYNPYTYGSVIPAASTGTTRTGQSYTNPGQLYPSVISPTYSPYSQQTTTTSQTSTSTSGSSDTAIQNLPNLSALWSGSYTLYDPNSTELGILDEGQVTLGLTQNKNAYQINGYMTVNNWEIVDENKKGRVLATATYTDSSAIDFVSVIVKFYPDLQNDEEPKTDSVLYVWVFSGSIYNGMLQGSLNISGPDNYSRAGTITLAKKQT